MESRKWIFQKKRKKRNQKIIFLSGIAVAYFCCSFWFKSLPGSFAWFYASTDSKGEIQNAKTSDLIQFKAVELNFNNNGNVGAAISIHNISNIDIPLKVELLVNHQILDSSAAILKPDEHFTPKMRAIPNISPDAKEIQFRIIGFNGYINEYTSMPLSREKLKVNEQTGNAVNPINPPENNTKQSDTTQAPTSNSTIPTETGNSIGNGSQEKTAAPPADSTKTVDNNPAPAQNSPNHTDVKLNPDAVLP